MTRALLAALALILPGLIAASAALAEPGFEFGEVTRFGGFDSSAYNAGRYGGPLTSGRFLDPTGFAVDPVDDTVYVVDRTSSALANPTSWRIQQFSPTGELKGTTLFTLPNEAPPRVRPNASAIVGLTVDHDARRLYALVVGSPPVSSTFAQQSFAQELLAWSTTPVAGGLLAANAAGGGRLPPDRLSSEVLGSPGTVGGLVSDEEQLLSGPSPLYEPQGIAVDPLEDGVADPVVIEAGNDHVGVGKGPPVIGDAVVQPVATAPRGGKPTGSLLASWSGLSLAGQLEGDWGPRGISTGPDRTLTVLLGTNETFSSNVSVVRLAANFSEATVLDSKANVPPLADFDETPMYMDEVPFLSIAGATISDLKGAGTQVVRLSGLAPGSAVGPYAAVVFTNRPGDDTQVGPNVPPGGEYWTSGESSAGEEFEANIGVRLLAPDANGAISDLQGHTIVNTLGNGARGGPCNIGAPRAVLAAGTQGTLWILDRGPQADREGANGQGREIIELAPGAAKGCLKPSGTFTISALGGTSKSGKETVTAGEESLTVPAGTQVTFSTTSVKRTHGKPFAFEWDLDGNPTNGPAGDGFEKVYEMQPPYYYYPPSSITYEYTRVGEYKVRLRMRTDYGVYTPPTPGTIIVTRAPHRPEASFTTTANGGPQVTFNASASTPGVGTILNYHWDWGDGSGEDESSQAPIVSHTYTQPGSYQVTLTVTNSAYQSVTSAPQTVTIAAPAPPHPAVSLNGPLYAIPAPFALHPVPEPAPDRTPTRLRPLVRFSGGVLGVTLTCPATKQLCAGAVSVETASAVATPGPRRKGKDHRASRLLLGHAAFSIPGGHTKTLAVRLSTTGMSLLKSRRHLKVLVMVSAHDSLGDPGAASLELTLNAAAASTHRSPLRGKRHPH
jgi:hypothetical protein